MLNIIGTGIILFGVWTLIKSLGLILIDPAYLREPIAKAKMEAFGPLEEVVYEAVSYIIVFIIMLVELLVRVFVGRSARKESRGEKGGWLYLVLTIIMIAGSIVSIVFSFVKPDLVQNSTDDSISGIVIEMTSVAIMIEMVIVAIRLRKITGKRDAA